MVLGEDRAAGAGRTVRSAISIKKPDSREAADEENEIGLQPLLDLIP